MYNIHRNILLCVNNEFRGERMKTVLMTLKEKLNTLGYNDSIINAVIGKLDLSTFEEKYVGEELSEDFITVEEYDEPNVEIIQMLLCITPNIISAEVLEGDITVSSTETSINTRFAIADYSLDKRSAVIGLSSDFKIYIIMYKPDPKVQNLYKNMTYEQSFKRDRDDITKDYYEAFVDNGRVTERRVREILTMLIADFVIDEMAVYDANPKIKLYDNEQKYAENLYSYSLRYINLRNNRIEILNKAAKIKMSSRNVQPGLITNDPYIKIDSLPPQVDFPLNTISYYWLYKNKSNQEEIAVFVPAKTYPQAMYSELKFEDPRIDEVVTDLTKRFKRDADKDMDPDDLKKILEKLNVELMIPSMDVIRANLINKSDMIEPIRYKYKIITDPAEFEEKLYITIEDNISKRYKYMLVESVLNDLTTIGNKLEYTDEKGSLVRKQSIADFNVNAPAVIVRRETFTNITKIPELLGYIYEDMKYYGTDGLPVPNIEIVFYIPRDGIDRTTVAMYNGTLPESAGKKHHLFNAVGTSSQKNYVIGAGNVLPGSTYVTVKYVTSKGEILKENKIGNVFAKTTFLPDVIPIITDKEGKEWKMDANQITPFMLTSNAEENNIEIKYIENYSRVHISFINREGKNIAPDKQEIMQVGDNFDVTKREVYQDNNGDEWKLVLSRPAKLTIKEEEEKNKIILVYDIERADVIIKFLTTSGIEIAKPKTAQGVVDKVYTTEIVPFIHDENGLGWDFLESSNPTVLVKNEGENVIKLLYEEAKRKVTIKLRSEENFALKDDVIEFVQIGEKYVANFEKEISDFELKEWVLNSDAQKEVIVNDDEGKNIIEAIYVPKLAKVAVKFLNTEGRPIKETEIENVQVGSRYNAENKVEVMDNFGKLWKWKEKSDGILVSEIDNENSVTLVYEPLIAKVTIKYFDTEMNELIPPKFEMLQAGTSYKNTPILKMTDNSGKKWIIDESKVPTIVVKKYEEENIVSVYYDKELTKVTLNFFDAYNNELREPQLVDAQIGAIFDTNLFYKITDIHNNRWMFTTSEPKNLTVRETENSFKLIYDEIKTKVLIKHINVNTEKTFVEDIVETVKLGGIYVPNIRQKILDKNKWQYKYIGEENVSIITKENEQENIIYLTYDEDRSKVILKYRNDKEEKIREDTVKEVQIGKEIKVDVISKFNDNNGLGWEYVSSDMTTKVVMQDDNVIMNHYKPLDTKIINKFVNQQGEEIIQPKVEILQVGKKYIPEKLPRVIDPDGAYWNFEVLSNEEIIAKEGENIITHTYEKLLANVTVNLLDEDDQLITNPLVSKIQVGTLFIPKYERNYTSPDGRAWIFEKLDFEKIKVLEEEEKNIIHIKYKKELVDVELCYFNESLAMIKKATVLKAQIGSMYLASPDKEIIDSNGIGWILKEDSLSEMKVNRNPEENKINISYDMLLVSVTVSYKTDKDEDIIKPLVEKKQVGITYMPEVRDYIEDQEGKEWIHALKLEGKFFTSGKKVEPIVVAREEKKNSIYLHYKPSMTKVVIRYVDSLGVEVKPQLQTEAQIGSKFTPEILEKIVGTGNKKWAYNPNSNATITINKQTEKNVVNLAYEAEKSAVIYTYQTNDGLILKEGKKILAQIGTVYKAEPENVIEDKEGKVWEFKSKNVEELIVNEDDTKNVIQVIYVPLMVNAILKFVTLNGSQIIPDQIQKGQLGSEFKPLIDETISDEEAKVSKFIKCEPERLKMKEVPLGSREPINVFTLTYEALFSKAKIQFKDVDGNFLKEDDVKELQVGTVFAPSLIQYVTDKNGIQWELITKQIDSLVVKEDESENIVTMVYEVAKAEVSVRYKDIDGNAIKKADIYNLRVGSEFVPEVEIELTDDKNRKWTFHHTDPVKLTIGSINNIINVIYQEKKVMTVIKTQSADGNTLKPDIKVKEQVGTLFNPSPQNKVIYDNNNMFRFSHNSPSEIIISENTAENVIIQVYSDEAVKVVKKTNNGYTAEMEKFIDKDLVQEAERKEKEKIAREEETKKEEELKKVNASVSFTDPHLQNLEKTINLNDEQKNTINELNELNTKIIQTLHEALENHGEDMEGFGLKEKLNDIMAKEKLLVQSGLKDILEEDKSGNKVLKIFEAITGSELSDKDFMTLQQKKSIIFADYFVNKNVADIEQASYIVDRGKVESGLECINQKLHSAEALNMEWIRTKVILIYEEAMLDNYYRARSVIKDDYFKDPESKNKLSTAVIVQVTNMLPNQAIRLLQKCQSLSVYQENELKAILKISTKQQLTTVSNKINEIKDGKVKKAAQKLLKEYTS